MKKYINNLLSILAIAVFALSSVSSCTKEKTNVGNVYIKDADGSPVPGTDVNLYYAKDSNATREAVEYTQTTDSKGYTQFVLELPSVYDIRAIHPSDGRVVEGLLILNEPGSTVTKELTFK